MSCEYYNFINYHFTDVFEHIGHDFIGEFLICCESALAEDGLLVMQVMNTFNTTLEHFPHFFAFS